MAYLSLEGLGLRVYGRSARWRVMSWGLLEDRMRSTCASLASWRMPPAFVNEAIEAFATLGRNMTFRGLGFRMGQWILVIVGAQYFQSSVHLGMQISSILLALVGFKPPHPAQQWIRRLCRGFQSTQPPMLASASKPQIEA